jgi:hypothetical protein
MVSAIAGTARQHINAVNRDLRMDMMDMALFALWYLFLTRLKLRQLILETSY